MRLQRESACRRERKFDVSLISINDHCVEFYEPQGISSTVAVGTFTSNCCCCIKPGGAPVVTLAVVIFYYFTMDRDSLVYRYVVPVREKKLERRNNCNFHLLCSPDFLSYHICNFSCLHYRAKLAEQAERFDEMVADMKNVASQPQEVGNGTFCCSISISGSAAKETKTKLFSIASSFS